RAGNLLRAMLAPLLRRLPREARVEHAAQLLAIGALAVLGQRLEQRAAPDRSPWRQCECAVEVVDDRADRHARSSSSCTAASGSIRRSASASTRPARSGLLSSSSPSLRAERAE